MTVPSLADLPRYAESDMLDTRLDDHVLIVTLNRPEKANAFDTHTMRELAALWARVAADPAIRCVVLTGAGKAFSAGADMSMLAAERTDIGATAAEELAFLPGPTVPIPVIAAVNGICAGGGLHFVGDADISIAGASARFVDPHVSVGQVTALEPLELFQRMRPDRVIRMALLGRDEMLDAETARESGLVSEVVPDEDLLPRARQLAQIIAAASPAAVRISRAVIRDYQTDLLGSHPERGWERIQGHRMHPDALEGPAAFIEKRAPRWSADEREK
ncbi:MAG: enoyl-CoA hydratase/isomerase family protein [Protaetiibacter sp.]